jgi:hypothetical protein
MVGRFDAEICDQGIWAVLFGERGQYLNDVVEVPSVVELVVV